jgi:hypothetical protein
VGFVTVQPITDTVCPKCRFYLRENTKSPLQNQFINED